MTAMWLYFHVCYMCACYTSGMVIPIKDNMISKKLDGSMSNMQNKSQNTFHRPSIESSDITANISKIRVKRQNSGAGKYAEASKMPQIKLLRLFLQMFKNAWDAAYVGGSHPMHPNVPKAIVALYKEKVVEFFIPDVGEDPKKQSQ